NDWMVLGKFVGDVQVKAGGLTLGTFFYNGVENLVGGTGIVTFQFVPMPGTQQLSVDGASGGNDWLDFSSFLTTVKVDLPHGLANYANLTLKVGHIQNVI